MTDTETVLRRVLALARAATPGPYFVAQDDAEDAPDHTGSGLALVETGRSSDPTVARLCEWQDARYIAALSPALVAALCEYVLADRAWSSAGEYDSESAHEAMSFAVAALDAECAKVKP